MFGKPHHNLIALGVLFALFVVGFAVHGRYAERARLLADAEQHAQTGAAFSAAYAGRTYEVGAILLEDALDHMEREKPSRAALRSFLVERTAQTAIEEDVIVTDASGRLLVATEPRAPPDVTFADREWFRAHAAGAGLVIGPVIRSRVGGDIMWTVSRRLEDESGRFTGVIAVGARAFGVAPTSSRPPTEPQATVWTREGRMVAATYVDFDAGGSAIPAPRPPGVDFTTTAPGLRTEGPTITAYAPVPGWPLLSVVTYEKAGVLAPWRRSVATSVAVVMAALLGGTVLVGAGVRSARREAQATARLGQALRETQDALAQRDLLLKEVHHRVKNSLMITSSLLGLQARSFEDARVRAAFDQTQARLSSISLVHEALYAGDLAEVDLADYLKRLLHEIAHAHGADERRVAIAVDIEPLRLPPERATLVGLIVSEVVSNAFKHAFPDVAGNIRVEAFCSPTGAADVWVIDDGVGYRAPAGAEAAGLGTKLVRVLAEQLGGRISFTNDQGTTFRLSFQAQGRLQADVEPPGASAPVAVS